MKRIAYAIVLLMFVAGSLFAVGCGGGEEKDVYVSTVALFDGALTLSEVAALGDLIGETGV